MIRQKFTVGLIVSAFTVGLTPAFAGQRSAPSDDSGSRPSNGDTVGTSVARDSGGGGSSSSSSGGSSGGGSDSSSGGAWIGGSTAPSESQRAPRSERVEQQRRGGDSNGGESTGRAVPRGSSGSGGSTTSTTGSNSGNDRGEGRSREGVPAYSRPRDGRQPLGAAVERRGGLPGGGGGGAYYPGVIYDPYYSYYRDPYYYSYGGRYSSYWSPYGYGYGLGYLAFDPFLSSAYGGYGYGPYGYGGYQGGYGSGSSYAGTGALRLKVKPADAQVYVDGYLVGVIDSFDGAFQRLTIEDGPHKVEVRADGYEPVQFDVMVNPGETITYKGQLKRVP